MQMSAMMRSGLAKKQRVDAEGNFVVLDHLLDYSNVPASLERLIFFLAHSAWTTEGEFSSDGKIAVGKLRYWCDTIYQVRIHHETQNETLETASRTLARVMTGSADAASQQHRRPRSWWYPWWCR